MARLGDVEPIAVYLLATELGELNTKAITKREGFGEALGSKAGSAGDVADYEATNTETAISMEVSKIVVPYVLLSIFTLIGLPFIIFVAAIWAFASGVSSGPIDSELAGRFLLLATAGVAATSYIDSNSFNNLIVWRSKTQLPGSSARPASSTRRSRSGCSVKLPF